MQEMPELQAMRAEPSFFFESLPCMQTSFLQIGIISNMHAVAAAQLLQTDLPVAS